MAAMLGLDIGILIRVAVMIFSGVLVTGCATPRAAFSYTSSETSVPLDVQFENTSSHADTYVWDFGDGNISTASSPNHRYTLSGRYYVKLVATKGGKQSDVTQEIIFEAPESCLLEMETSLGVMAIQLYEETPKHRDNITKLAEEGFYDGLLFHRVINGFVIQGGDPNSRNAKADTRIGNGGLDYLIDAEFNSKLVHTKGALAAASTGGSSNPMQRSSGSQFYIVHGRPVTESQLAQIELEQGIEYTAEQKAAYLELGGSPQLDMNYTVYGKVIHGMEVIDAIATVSTLASDRPKEDVIVKSLRVIK